MDILIGFAVAAMKAAVSAATENGVIQALANQGIQTGSDKYSQYLKEAQKQISEILTDKSLEKWDIPQDQTAYIREELKELFDTISDEDNLLKDCQYDEKSLTNALYKKYEEQKKNAIEYGNQIRKILSVMAEKAISLEKERAGFIPDILIDIRKGQDVQAQLIRTIFSIVSESTKTTVEDKRNVMPSEFRKRLPDRTEEYQNKWNENMFLNDFDEDDEDAGTNIHLCQLYQTSYYSLNGQEKKLSNLDNRLYKHAQGQKTQKRMLLILGHPGMGKSTLITWFINQYQKKPDPHKKEILVYRFTDIQINWNLNIGENVDSVILEYLNMTKEDLNGKILILDGFDEISVEGNRKEVLNRLYHVWARDTRIKNFSLLITCRENYIEDLSQLAFSYITLQPWDRKQIYDFCRKYGALAKSQISNEAITKMQNMEEVFGIPILLYMTLALEIAVKDESSVAEVYNQIFSLEAGGIYDRCLKKSILRSWDDAHRITQMKKQIHQFSREISMWMFENNPDQASIPQVEYENIQERIFEENSIDAMAQKKDIFIGNYFKLIRCYDGIGTKKLSFIHRSMYEYFVTEMILSEIEQTINKMTEVSQKQLASILGYRLKSGRINYTIGQYLKAEVSSLTAAFSKEKKNRLYIWLEDTVGKMLDHGMLYYTGKNIKELKNAIEKELNIFRNLLDILRLFLHFSEQTYILQGVNKNQLVFYIRGLSILSKGYFSCPSNFFFNYYSGLNFSHICLRGAELRGADLRNSNLGNTDLGYANLRNANLRNADLEHANLRNADLEHANLSNVKIDSSIWNEDDVEKYSDIIEQCSFNIIYVYPKRSDETITLTHQEFLSRYHD